VTFVYTIYNTGNVVLRNLSVAVPGLGQLTCMQDGSSIVVDGQVLCRYATAKSSTLYMHTAVRLPDCTARQCSALKVGASCRQFTQTVHTSFR
jgi:hypothetical protein